MHVVIITYYKGNHCDALIERLDFVEWKLFLRSAAAVGAQLLLPGTAELSAHSERLSRQQSFEGAALWSRACWLSGPVTGPPLALTSQHRVFSNVAKARRSLRGKLESCNPPTQRISKLKTGRHHLWLVRLSGRKKNWEGGEGNKNKVVGEKK